MGFHFIPQAIKIFLDADLKVRAQRILQDKRKEEKATNLKEMIKKIRQRQESEIKRYQKYYHLNPYNKTNFDLVLDTTKLTPEKIVEKILKFLKKQKPYKTHHSPD